MRNLSVLDDAKNSISLIEDEINNDNRAFERIADLARDLDENNWKENSQEIFDIAYARC